jgi:hypothetical protein
MKKKKWMLIAVAVLLVLAGVVVSIFFLRKPDNTDQPPLWETVGDEGEDSMNIYDWMEEAAKTDKGFPYEIEGSSLVIMAIKPYTGIFLEDGTDTEIENVSAMLVQNRSEDYIEYAKITCKYEGTEYVYEIKTLEPNAMIMVQESSGKTYTSEKFKDCSAVVAPMDGLELSRDEVKVETNSLGNIRITNVSGKDIPCVRIFYKMYLEDAALSVGGITYVAKVTDLKEGEARVIMPQHFSQGLSRIMMIRTYDTTE